MRFTPSESPDFKKEKPGWWFIFRSNELLVKTAGEQVEIPFVDDTGLLDLKLKRVHFLGTLDGYPCYTAGASETAVAPEGMNFEGIRGTFGLLGEELFQLACRSLHILQWDRNSQFCGRCGSTTRSDTLERAKICEECGLRSYPRISPATITAVRKGRQILLARAKRFPAELYSVIAGFVEPGETLEECVEREIMEETGIKVKNIRYFGSQPWPFPDSLMIAFTAEYAGGDIRVYEKEIVDAGWFSVDTLPRIPEKLSIARRLIDRFIEDNS
jgi:NAD+ diphosphatase